MSGDGTKADTVKMCFNQFLNLLLWIALNCTRIDSFLWRKNVKIR